MKKRYVPLVDKSNHRVSCEEEKMALRDALVSRGCDIRFSYSMDGFGIVEESYMKNEIKFDINYYITEGDESVCYLMFKDPDRQYGENELSVVKLSVPAISELDKKDFNGIDINVPKNAEEYLAARYGERSFKPPGATVMLEA